MPPDLQGLQRCGYEQQQSPYPPQQPAEELPFRYPPQQTLQQSSEPLCQPAAQQALGQGSLQQQQQEQQPMLWYGMFGSQLGTSAGLHSFTPTHTGAQVSLQQAPASVQLVEHPADGPHQQPGGPGFSLEDCFRGWGR